MTRLQRLSQTLKKLALLLDVAANSKEPDEPPGMIKK